jgi:uncharacterized protein
MLQISYHHTILLLAIQFCGKPFPPQEEIMLQKLQDELKQSMKSRDELRTSVLRMLISDFKYAQIEKKGALDEAESIQVIKKAIKKRKESIEMYEKGGRPELAKKEADELGVLQSFVPAEMDESVARQKIEELIAELGATDKKDMGRVIKEAMSRYKGQLDGKMAQKLISEKLGN